MKYSLKHKIILSFAAVVTLAGVLAPTTSAFSLNLAEPTRVFAARVSCPPNNPIAVKSTGGGDAMSCCPAIVAKSAEKDRPRSCLFAKYLNPLVNMLTAVVGVVVAGSVILGAIQVSSSAGDPQKAANGKNRIRNALFGLLAYLLLFAFLQFIIPGGRFT